MTEDGEEQICIGSMDQLKSEIEKSVQAGLMSTNPLANFVVGDMSAENYATFDLHRPFVDDIILVSSSVKLCVESLTLSMFGLIRALCPTPNYIILLKIKKCSNNPIRLISLQKGLTKLEDGFLPTRHSKCFI